MKIVTPSILIAVLLLISSLASAQEATREEFNEFCNALQGRWIGEITWAADWPGLGKKGEKVTSYWEGKIAEDGNALIGKFYGGNGSGTWLVIISARRIGRTNSPASHHNDARQSSLCAGFSELYSNIERTCLWMLTHIQSMRHEFVITAWTQ